MDDDLYDFLVAHPELADLIRKDRARRREAPVTPKVQLINALALGVLIALIVAAVVYW